MKNVEAGGLFAGGKRVPLRGVSIDVKASGVAGQVTVAQRYCNEEKVPVEAVYSFPLQESAAVSGFEVEIGGRRIVGKVEEREKAFEQYDDAMAQGHGAFLVDQDRPNIFTASVGNLLPQQEAIVRLSYVTELEQTKDSIRLLIPTTISPRYIPADVAREMDPAELDHVTPPTVAGGVPYGLKLSVDFQAPCEIAEISCPSHPASTRLSGRSAQVELMGSNIQLDQDFVLNITLAQSHQASAIVARDGDGVRAAMINLFPDLSSLKRGPCEFIFIVDRSGSMGGTSIQQARNALLLALRSLEEGDSFNVIGFGDSYETMFTKSVAYSQSTLDEASKKIAGMDANLGGTELLAPLNFLAGSRAESNLPRQIVLLTDGQVGNEAQCLEVAAKLAANARIFGFGIGHGVSEHLVRGLSRATNGQAEFIHPNERIEPKVMRQFSRMASGALTNVRVDFGGLKTDLVAPAQLPQLFDGDRFTVYARIVGGAANEIAITADSPNGALRFPVKIDLEKPADDRAVPVLMARKAIQELEEGRGGLLGSAQSNRKENATRSRILELAVRYQIMSSATSFVAVEERQAGTQTQAAELRRVPVALTKGWGAVEESCDLSLQAMPRMAKMKAAFPAGGAGMPPPAPRAAACAPMQAPIPAPSSAMKFESASESAEPAEGSMLSSITGFFGRAKSAVAGAAMPATADRAGEPADPLLKLTSSQRADGSFDLSASVLEASKANRKKIDAAIKQLGGDKAQAERITSTLLALAVLERDFADRRDEWKMIADKAERWLSKQKLPAGAADWKSWAKSAL